MEGMMVVVMVVFMVMVVDGGDGNDDDDDDGGMKRPKCRKKSQSAKPKKANVEVVAQVDRQEGDKEEEEEEVLEQGGEGDQSTRAQPSTSQAGLTTQAATAQSLTTPTPIRRSSRKVTPTQMYTPGTALTSPTSGEGPPGAPRGASAKRSLQGKGKKRKIDPDLTPPKLDMRKRTMGGDGDNAEQGTADPDAHSRFAFHSPIVIVEIEGDKKNWDQSSYASKAMCELASSLAFNTIGFVIYVFHDKVVIVLAWHRVKDMTIHTSCETISMQESGADLLQQWKYLTTRIIEILIVQINGAAHNAQTIFERKRQDGRYYFGDTCVNTKGLCKDCFHCDDMSEVNTIYDQVTNIPYETK